MEWSGVEGVLWVRVRIRLKTDGDIMVTKYSGGLSLTSSEVILNG